MALYEWVYVLALGAVGVLGFGILNSGLHAAGYPTLGTAVWVVGYGFTALLLWWGWLRHVDLVGASG